MSHVNTHQESDDGVDAPMPIDGVDFFDPTVNDCPYHAYRTLRDDAPVWFDPRLRGYVVTRYDDVRTVLVAHKDWWGHKAGKNEGNLTEVTLLPIKSNATRLAAGKALEANPADDTLLAYLDVNESALGQVAKALKGAARVPGCVFKEVESLAVTGRRGS